MDILQIIISLPILILHFRNSLTISPWAVCLCVCVCVCVCVGGGVFLYISYMCMCRPKGYGFGAVLVWNRVIDFAFLVYFSCYFDIVQKHSSSKQIKKENEPRWKVIGLGNLNKGRFKWSEKGTGKGYSFITTITDLLKMNRIDGRSKTRVFEVLHRQKLV